MSFLFDAEPELPDEAASEAYYRQQPPKWHRPQEKGFSGNATRQLGQPLVDDSYYTPYLCRRLRRLRTMFLSSPHLTDNPFAWRNNLAPAVCFGSAINEEADKRRFRQIDTYCVRQASICLNTSADSSKLMATAVSCIWLGLLAPQSATLIPG